MGYEKAVFKRKIPLTLKFWLVSPLIDSGTNRATMGTNMITKKHNKGLKIKGLAIPTTMSGGIISLVQS